MKPPICVLCGKDFRDSDEGDLVYFKKSDSDKAWDKLMDAQDQEGFTGHPPYAEWFCGEHYTEAKKLQNYTLEEALKILYKE